MHESLFFFQLLHFIICNTNKSLCWWSELHSAFTNFEIKGCIQNVGSSLANTAINGINFEDIRITSKVGPKALISANLEGLGSDKFPRLALN